MMRTVILSIVLLATFAVATFAVAQNKPAAEEAVPAQTAAVGNTEKLVIGVREAARPFAFGPEVPVESDVNVSTKSGPLRAAGYDGYMVYICDEVLKQMLINQSGTPQTLSKDIRVVNVDNEMRKEGAVTDRFDLLANGEIDILCDPASINRDRVRRFAVSPPLFLTGIGYLQLKAEPAHTRGQLSCKNRARVGVVGSTNAASDGIAAILRAGEWKKYRENIIGDLRSGEKNTTLDIPNCTAEAPPDGKLLEVWYAPTHTELARAFCDGLVTYYVGDLEIISQHVLEFPGCEVSSGGQSFTSDRYAIFADINYVTKPWKAERIARFFEVLNREIITSVSLLDRAYVATFGAAPRSQALELFFWSIRGAP
jgi:ABC-type amino acid transport substrate-binding protein